MLKRFASFIRQHDWFAVGIEILVVMIGLLLAFQLDRWRGDIADKRMERVYIDRLISDVESDIPAIEYAIELQSLRLDLVELLMKVSSNPEAALDSPTIFLGAIAQAAYTYTPALTSHTFENLLSTGDLRLIRADSVKNVMFKYYGFDEEQRQYRPLQFSTESRHFELSAGILSLDQETRIQDEWLFFRPDNIESAKQAKINSDGVIEAANRLGERTELIAWLPQVRSMQLEQIQVHGMRLDRAREALAVLQDYAREIDH